MQVPSLLPPHPQPSWITLVTLQFNDTPKLQDGQDEGVPIEAGRCVFLQISQPLCLQGCYGASPFNRSASAGGNGEGDSSSSPFLPLLVSCSAGASPHRNRPCCGPLGPDSPTAEWQRCCCGCAGRQLHASPSPGGHSKASSGSTSAQLVAAEGLQGMIPRAPAEPVGSVGPKQLVQGSFRTRPALSPRPRLYEVAIERIPPQWAPPSFGWRPPVAAGPEALQLTVAARESGSLSS